jgi:hypothetical protein
VLLATLGLALAGCGGADAREAVGAEKQVLGVAACKPGSYQRLETTAVAHGAAVRRRAAAYDRPGGRVVARFGRRNVNRVRTVFGAVGALVDGDCRATWYRVRLPRKPNGSMGWVRAREVEVETVRTRLLVDLSARRVTLYRDGRRVLTTRAAIGSPATPTPVGTYYVNQRLVPSSPYGPFGPGAIGISSFSEVLTGWTQGGPIAIHGTNRPDLIGKAVSNGCIRVRNDALRRLFRASRAGTPVVVQR